MNDVELRAECVRQASANLCEQARDTDQVIAEAQKLYNFIIGTVSVPAVNPLAPLEKAT